MPLVDTHCHLQSEAFDADREEVLLRALERLDWLIVVGDDLENCRRALELVRPRVYAALGFHPYHAPLVNDESLQTLRALAGQPGVVAIGEIGLDYFNEFAPRAEQRRAFPAQLELAAELGLPVVIHNRAADEDTHAVLSEHLPRLGGCVMHCYGSDAAWAERFVALGCCISFAGNLTYPKAQALRDAALATPLDRLLVETDAPYLSPQARRGKRCEPAFVEHTAAMLAELKGLEPEEMSRITVENARRVFRVNP